jgi:hypothetical protein
VAALSFAFAIPTPLAPRAHAPNPQDPLELTIIGPSSIHKGQEATFKAALRSRSAVPIVIAPSDASLDFELRWTVLNSSGRELLRLQPLMVGFACPVGGPGWSKDLVRRLRDSDLALLRPGESLEFPNSYFIHSILDEYVFTGPGRYYVIVTYSYVPPLLEGNNGRTMDGFDQKYDLTGLSPQTLEILRHSFPLTATATTTLILE